MHLTGSLLLLLTAFTTTFAKPCDVNDSKFNGLKAPLLQSAAHIPNQPQATFTIRGTAEIVDGCNFIIRNYTFLPGMAGAMWVGRRGNDTVNTVGVNLLAVQSNNLDSQKIPLRQDAGAPAVSWYDFDTLVLYSDTAKFEMASARFDGLATQGPSPDGGQAGGNGTAQGNKNSASSSIVNSAAVVGGAVTMTALTLML